MTPRSPLITLVTVCYEDRENVIKTCNSIAVQTDVEDVEHLLIDGGSSDGTQEWYSEHAPLESSFMISEPDGGIFDAMNKGFRRANGQYVAFLNAGDTFSDSDVLARICRAVRASKPSWMYSKANVVGPDGSIVRSTVGKIPYSRTHHALGFATICHQTVLMQKALLEELGGFDLRFGTAADYHLLLKAALRANPVARDELEVLYEAGGVSDTDVYRQLFRRHRARADAFQMGIVPKVCDFVWTVLQVLVVRGRKLCKPLLRRLGFKRFLGRVVG
ncbi:glycosyltransferase [Arthrobacter sp. BHU FT2]|nr:glycosyltransferase [Arthrobacter sp. BHU FT2]